MTCGSVSYQPINKLKKERICKLIEKNKNDRVMRLSPALFGEMASIKLQERKRGYFV